MSSTSLPRKRRRYHVGGDEQGVCQKRRSKRLEEAANRPPDKISWLQVVGLCNRCSRLNLDFILRKPYRGSSSKFLTALSAVSEWRIDTCPFCSLLAAILPEQTSDKDCTIYSLRVYASKMAPEMGWQTTDTVAIGVGYEGKTEVDHDRRFERAANYNQRFNFAYLVPQLEGVDFVRILQGESIDFKIVGDWLSFCREYHIDCGFSEASSVPNMKLIDCEARVLVPGQNHPYVALSYVWGSKETDNITFLDCLSESFPCTIEDAITVTLKLGFRYLWIDRYCINQQAKGEAYQQIRSMHLIYKGAELSIIAAAGESPSYGLPGVSRQNRSPQARAKVGRHFLVSTLENPQFAIKNSTWMSRGWTYQEAVLSRRRLIFTDQQIYFECYGMCCCEALNLPLRDLHTESRGRFESLSWGDSNLGLFPKGIGSSGLDVIDRIEEYTEKSLTYPSDILNGILGVLVSFQTSYCIRNYVGIPIIPTSSKSSPDMFLEGFLLGLCWELQNPSLRRPGFPSWSWTGWFAPVVWRHIWDARRICDKIDLLMELHDGETLDCNEFQKSYDKINKYSRFSNFVHISAWTIPIIIVNMIRRSSLILLGLI
jgi:hypothetical protein